MILKENVVYIKQKVYEHIITILLDIKHKLRFINKMTFTLYKYVSVIWLMSHFLWPTYMKDL